MYHVTIFGLELTLDPIAFTLPIGDGWSVYWYGIIIALGFMLAVIYGYRRSKDFGIDVDRLLDVVLVATPCAILGARAYYVIFDPNGSVESVAEFFGFGGSGISGLAIYGGIIGAVIGGVVMAYIRKVKIFDLLDLASIGFLIGQGIGRWGNFINQEAYGSFTGSDWWGMTSEKIVREMGEGLVHPCFLYESVWCLLGAFLLHRASRNRHFSGEIALMYCAWYGFGRAFIELLRTDSLMIGNMKVSFLLSLLICVAAIIILVVSRNKRKARVANDGYVSMFEDEMQESVEDASEEAEAEEEGDNIEDVADTEVE